ncbi:MAG: RNA-directed DNA polymerase [Planctomyces sp.]|nr:RNA-directed DNA polymerase [Planctomyces sp.]
MSSRKSIARRLTVAVLAGRFGKDSILERTLPLIQGSPTWLKRFVDQLIRRFGNQRPKRSYVLAFLLSNREFIDASLNEDFDVQPYLLPSEFSPSPGNFEAIDVIRLRSSGEVAAWLKLNENELSWFADRHQLERLSTVGPLRHYRYFWKLKRHGRCRLIEAPKFRMREIQRRLLREILSRIPVHNAAHGFRRGRSANSHAAPHVGRSVVLKLDLEDFFPSVPPMRLTRLLMHTGYPEDVAEILTALCCNHVPSDVFDSFPHRDDWKLRRRAKQLYCRPHIPQGAPTSPVIANLCAYRLDTRLAGLAQSANATYTRYADDLLFSGDDQFSRGIDRFRILAAAIAMEEGFAVNHHKTRVMKRSIRQEAVGLVLNEKINTRRDEFDRLKATLHRCILKGPEAVNCGQHAHFRQHLIGRIQHIAQSSQSRHTKLMALFDQINWSDPQSPST